MKTMKQLLVAIVVLTMVTVSARAQCTYNVINALNETITISIPCDFPLYYNTGNATADRDNYNNALAKWHSDYPSTASLDISPKSIGVSTYIEIFSSEMDNFTKEKQSLIQAMSYYYHIKTNKTEK